MTYAYYSCPLGLVKIGRENGMIVCVHCMDMKETEVFNGQKDCAVGENCLKFLMVRREDIRTSPRRLEIQRRVGL